VQISSLIPIKEMAKVNERFISSIKRGHTWQADIPWYHVYNMMIIISSCGSCVPLY